MRDREMPREVPSEAPSFQPLDVPRVDDALTLTPSDPPFQSRLQKPPGVQLSFHDCERLVLSDSFVPHDRPELRELFVPSDSDVPLDDDRPVFSDCPRATLCDVLREVLSDCDREVLRDMLSEVETLSLSDLTSRMTSVSPISFETYSREKLSSRLKNTLSPELARKVSQLSL